MPAKSTAHRASHATSRHARHPKAAVLRVASDSNMYTILCGVLLAAMLLFWFIMSAQAATSCPLGITDTPQGKAPMLETITRSAAPIDRSFAETPLAVATFGLG